MTEFEALKERWANEYHTPAVTGINPNEQYVACLVVPTEGEIFTEFWHFEQPTDADAELVGKYIDYRNIRWYGRARLSDAVLDIDPGVNTISFVKTTGGWRFSRRSWRAGPPVVPSKDADKQYATLLELIDHTESSFDHEVSERWITFKNENGIG